MSNHENELERLFDAPLLQPPANFLTKVMSQVENIPSAQLLKQGVVHQHKQVKIQLKVVALNVTKLAAFVFGIMLATAAV